jgi:hypothetical protein
MTPWGEAKFNSHIPALGTRGSPRTNDTTTFRYLPPGIPRILREPGIMDFYPARGSIVQLWEFTTTLASFTWMVGIIPRAWLDRVGIRRVNALRVGTHPVRGYRHPADRRHHSPPGRV